MVPDTFYSSLLFLQPLSRGERGEWRSGEIARNGIWRGDARDNGRERGHEGAKMVEMRPELGRFAQVGGMSARSSQVVAEADGGGRSVYFRALASEPRWT